MSARSSSRRRLAGVAGVVVLCAMTSAQEPTLEIRRERVLVVNMRIAPLVPAVEEAARIAPAGVVWLRTVPSTPPTPIMRLHVRIDGNAGGWTLRVLQSDGTEVERIGPSPTNVARDMWTDEIPGGAALLELSHTASGAVPMVSVSEYAFEVVPTVEQAIHGKDQRLSITQAPLRVRRHAGAIARLRFIIEGEGQAFCTGFMVGARLMITNEHCIRTKAEAESAIADFNYNSAGVVAQHVRVDKIVSSSAPLDYSLLQLAAEPPTGTGRLFFGGAILAPTGGTPAPDTHPLFVIEHPSGLPKQASIADCGLAGLQRVGVQTGNQSDFGHTCDTLGGSSGSPVLDWDTGQVVGLHHLGFHPGVSNPVNQAVHVRLVLDHIGMNAANESKEVARRP
jgi:hypothetical protein